MKSLNRCSVICIAYFLSLTLFNSAFLRPVSGQSDTIRRLTSNDYQKRIDQVAKKGHTPISVQVEVKDGVDYYTLRTVRIRSIWATHHRMTQAIFDEKKKFYESRNFRIKSEQTYQIKGEKRFVAIWEEIPSRPITFWTAQSKVTMTGKAVPQLKPFDQLLQKFLIENQLPGATLAISRNGKLIFSRGYGYNNFEVKRAMAPNDLMRIASISKSLTSAAIMRLVEQKKLSLTDNVFDIIPHEAYDPNAELDARLKQVTVLHCLQHSGGWDRAVSFDPMFRDTTIAKTLNVSCPPGSDNIIRYMLNQPLDHDPGTKYAYSNFGYSVLGRVIEKISGQDYETFVREQVLKKIGVRRMKIGATLRSEKEANEVTYYARKNGRRAAVVGKVGEIVPTPYGAWHLEAMDAHGGWIASASDLVKFAAAFDNRDRSKILSKQSIETMFARPAGKLGLEPDGSPNASFYGCGWMVRPAGKSENTWHGGLLDGTSTLLVRRHDGLNWAVLFNKADCKDGKTPSGKIDSLLHRAAAQVKSWPK